MTSRNVLASAWNVLVFGSNKTPSPERNFLLREVIEKWAVDVVKLE